MTTYEKIRTVFFILSAVGASFTVLFGFLFKYFFQHKTTFERLKEYLRNNQPLDAYHQTIKKLLYKAEVFFGKQFSFKSYDRILLITLAYPIIFFILCYLVSGNNLIGSVEVFQEQQNFILRAGWICILLISVALLTFLLKKKNETKGYVLGKVFIGEMAITYLIFAVAIGITFYFGVIVAVIGIAVVVVLNIYNENMRGFALRGFYVVLFVFVLTIGVVIWGGRISQKAEIAILFFLVFPLANSVFDFISFEISRFFTNKSLKLNSKFIISFVLILDFAIAVTLLLGTAFLIPICIDLYNKYWIPLSKSSELINWKEIAILARDYPFSEGLGVTLMLFSTLIWTAVHAVIAFVSFLLAPIGRDRIISLLNKNELTNIEFSLGAFWITLNFGISIFCLIVIPFFLVPLIWGIPIAEQLYNFVIKHHFLS